MRVFGLFCPYSRHILSSRESDLKECTAILEIIRDEEARTEEIKKAMRLQKNSNGGAGVRVPVVTVADLLDGNEVAVEQSFNREQVQEQEQVCICVRFIPAIIICIHVYTYTRCATCARMCIHSLLCCVYALVLTYTLYTMYIRVYVQYAVCMYALKCIRLNMYISSLPLYTHHTILYTLLYTVGARTRAGTRERKRKRRRKTRRSNVRRI